MRAIDADALMRAMYHRAFETDGDTMWQSGCWVRYRAIEQVVKEQPTVESERETGKWIYGEHGVTMCDGYRCDKCNYFVPWDYQRKSINFIEEYHFCPNCGARMEKSS